jgi:hypothetical protein
VSGGGTGDEESLPEEATTTIGVTVSLQALQCA